MRAGFLSLARDQFASQFDHHVAKWDFAGHGLKLRTLSS
ncbi:hypothetical protein ACVII1_008459 [Bradyrhizobium elkanii]